jgi:hypothetical protein
LHSRFGAPLALIGDISIIYTTVNKIIHWAGGVLEYGTVQGKSGFGLLPNKEAGSLFFIQAGPAVSGRISRGRSL